MKKIFFSKLGIRIFAVLLAASLWIFVTYKGQTEMAIETPISFKNIPKGLEMLRQSTKTVTLNLRGHERLLKGLRPMDISVVVDLSKAKKGESTYYLDKSSILIPGTAEILRLDPSSVRVVLDETLVKTIPVRASITGMPEKGFRIVSISVKPSVITVEGARTDLQRIPVLRTEDIDVTGLDSDITETVRLNTNGRNVRPVTPEVTVSIAIKR